LRPNPNLEGAPTAGALCYVRRVDARTAESYPWALDWVQALPRVPEPKAQRASRMEELARVYWEAVRVNGGKPPERKKFFLKHMGRVPSRAYMSKIARWSRDQGWGDSKVDA